MKPIKLYQCSTCEDKFHWSELCKHKYKILEYNKQNNLENNFECKKCCESDIIRGLGIKSAWIKKCVPDVILLMLES